MSAKTPPIMWITEDDDRQIALLTGNVNALAILNDLGLEQTARWSRSAHGWTVPTDGVADLVAYCACHKITCKIRPRTETARR